MGSTGAHVIMLMIMLRSRTTLEASLSIIGSVHMVICVWGLLSIRIIMVIMLIRGVGVIRDMVITCLPLESALIIVVTRLMVM